MEMMQAFRLLDWHTVGFEEVAVPEPGHGEVLLRVGGAGVCGSDVHFTHLGPGQWTSSPPWTLGHETAGWVERCGPGANRYEPGAAVIATGIHSCGKCRYCLRGDDNLCQLVFGGRGAGSDGGFAEFVVVPERELVALGSLDPRVAAPLADAGHTAYAAVKGALSKLTPESTALVIGAGGLGSFATQYIKLLSASRLLVADTREERRAYAVELGADLSLKSDAELASAVSDATNGERADVVFDFVGNQDTIQTAVASAAPGGAVVLVGMGGGTLPLEFGRTPAASTHLYWQMGGSMHDLIDVVNMAERGLLSIEVEHFAFQNIESAFSRLDAGEMNGRAVVLPNG